MALKTKKSSCWLLLLAVVLATPCFSSPTLACFDQDQSQLPAQILGENETEAETFRFESVVLKVNALATASDALDQHQLVVHGCFVRSSDNRQANSISRHLGRAPPSVVYLAT